jgi:FOG: Ankyrin repeat
MSVAAKALVDVTGELSRLVESGDVEALAHLLPRVGNINARNRHGTTVLMQAARCGHAQIVRLLLEHGADPNLTRNDKFTALALAAFFGHTETVKTLMEFGARTEAVTRSGASAQTWATARTFAEVARCLGTPAPKTTPSPIQLQRNLSRRRFLALSVIATFVVIVCCAFGALVLTKSEAHDLAPAPVPPPPPQVETRVVNPDPPPPAPEPVVTEAPVAESRTANFVRPTLKKAPAPSRAVKPLPVVSETPAEEVKISEPPVVAKPKFESPKPVALSPQIMAPSKKAKVIQWP